MATAAGAAPTFRRHPTRFRDMALKDISFCGWEYQNIRT
jgi:hypothetical protein